MTIDERAQLAAQAATQVGFYLHGAELTGERAEKRRLLARAFQAYGGLVRQMSELEGLAPNAAREGLEVAAKLREFVEAKAE